jgi:hypothetical protein
MTAASRLLYLIGESGIAVDASFVSLIGEAIVWRRRHGGAAVLE